MQDIDLQVASDKANDRILFKKNKSWYKVNGSLLGSDLFLWIVY